MKCKKKSPVIFSAFEAYFNNVIKKILTNEKESYKYYPATQMLLYIIAG